MKKTILLILGGFIIGALISPVVGMAINSTRNLILGMAPDEAILVLADKIDENLVSSEQSKSETNAKMAELQLTIDAQQSKLVEQQKTIDSQAVSLNSTKQAINETNATVAKQKDCSADVSKYCVSSSFRDADEFKKFLKNYEQFDNYNEYKSKYTTQFNNCQTAMKCE